MFVIGKRAQAPNTCELELNTTFKFAVLGAKPKTAKFNHLKTLAPLDRSQYLKTKFHHFLQGLKILTSF